MFEDEDQKSPGYSASQYSSATSSDSRARSREPFALNFDPSGSNYYKADYFHFA